MKNKKPSKKSVEQAKIMDSRVFDERDMSYLEMIVEARIFRLFPNQYGTRLATKLIKLFKMRSFGNRDTASGDAAICFDGSGKVEFKHSFMTIKGENFAIKNIRLWQNFNFFVISLIDYEKDYNPEIYVIHKNDIAALQEKFGKQNSDNLTKSKRTVGQSIVFKRGSEVHQYLKEKNILPTTTYASYAKFIRDFQEQNPNCKTISNYSNYMVLSDGSVWNISRNRQLKPMTKNGGFQYVRMTDDKGVTEQQYLPKILATAFIPNPEGFKYVKHKNNDNMDNRIENLYWTDEKSESFNTKGRVKSVGLSRKKYSVVTSTGQNMVITVPTV